MPSNEKIIYVYDDFTFDRPKLLGRLYADAVRGGESASFEYDPDWLTSAPYPVSLDPDLFGYGGRQYPNGKPIFGIFSDASPDRWGRRLLSRKEWLLADREGRKPRKLCDSDFLLGVSDEVRMGGLRFKTEETDEFSPPARDPDREAAAPTRTALRSLEEAAKQFEYDERALNEAWLDKLIRPGAALGGARPKITLTDAQGQLWIAKFPSKNDETDTCAWEKVVNDLARLCGLNVPESKLETLSRPGSAFLVKRFDREGSKRIHYASAMTLLGRTDGASASDGCGYLDLVSLILSSGSDPERDLIELWKRMVFNMAVSNTDDHLRNHAFLLTKTGWTLSPLYDVNPVPYGDTLSLRVNEDDNRISVPLAIETAPRFHITEQDAKTMAEEILTTVRENWEQLAAGYGVSRGKIGEMRPAFRACYT